MEVWFFDNIERQANLDKTNGNILIHLSSAVGICVYSFVVTNLVSLYLLMIII